MKIIKNFTSRNQTRSNPAATDVVDSRDCLAQHHRLFTAPPLSIADPLALGMMPALQRALSCAMLAVVG